MLLCRKSLSLPVCALIVLVGLPGSAAERVLLRRTFPTDITWGEISVAEGPPITVPIREDRVEYSFSLTIACNQRQRREDLNDLSGAAVETPWRRRGAIYFATKLPGGRETWKGVVKQLHTRLVGLTPETFGTFAQRFGSALIGAEPILEGAFEGVMCLTGEGQSDQGWEIHRKIDKNGVATGTSAVSDPRSICSKLIGALEGESPSDILASRFEVCTQREESLTAVGMQVSGDGHASWPSGAGVEYAEVPEGAKGYTSSGERDGTAWYEELRPARGGGPPQTRNAYLLKAKSRNATIPENGLDSDALVTRWAWRVRDASLGTEPKTSDHEADVLNTAFLFVEAHGQVDQEEFERTVARDFASSEQTPGTSLLQGLIKKHVRYLVVDAMYVVFCDPARPREATYCVASACKQVLNAEDFCGVLASRLDFMSAR